VQMARMSNMLEYDVVHCGNQWALPAVVHSIPGYVCNGGGIAAAAAAAAAAVDKAVNDNNYN
jgi:hypothetical protein